LAVALEFLDFLVRVETIRAKYPGGWEACLSDHARLIGQRVWYDEYLFRDGAMGPADIGRLIDEWLRLGFEPTETVASERRWKDVCVVESALGEPTLPCRWIAVDVTERVGYLRGRPRGEAVRPTRTRFPRVPPTSGRIEDRAKQVYRSVAILGEIKLPRVDEEVDERLRIDSSDFV
jgi:hypothetical protein